MFHLYRPLDGIEHSETLEYKIQMLENYPEKSIQQVPYLFGIFRPSFGAGTISNFKIEFFILVLLSAETENPND
jgi:hypothetical protein